MLLDTYAYSQAIEDVKLLLSFVDIFDHNSQLRQKYYHCDAQKLIALENGEKFKHYSRKHCSPIILFTFLLSHDF